MNDAAALTWWPASQVRRLYWRLYRRLQAFGGAVGVRLRRALLHAARRVGPAELSLYEDAFAALTPQALRALTCTGVFDALAAGPTTLEALARRLPEPVQPAMLERLLRFGVAQGWVAVDRRFASAPRYRLGPLGGPLVGHHPRSMAPFVTYAASHATTLATAELETVLRRGGAGFVHAHGRSPWRYFEERFEEGAVFDRAMQTLSGRDVAHVARALPAAATANVCDLAGGTGGLAMAILAEHPAAHVTLFERADVVAVARARMAAACAQGRATLVAGDLFGPLPNGCNAYLLRNVLHDWSDADAVRILRGVAAAMKPDATVYLIETLNDAAVRWLPVLSDVAMAVVTDGGRQRSRGEWRALANEAGLTLTDVVVLPQPMHLLALRRRSTG